MSQDVSNSSQPRFPLLVTGNYTTWSGNAKAWFMRQGLWGIVSGRTKKPVQTSTTPLTATESAAITTWEDKAEKAAGELYLLVSDEQKVHFAGISDDPCAMWKKLESIHLQKRPGARFNAYEALFSIKKAPDESLTALMTRVDTVMQQIQNLRPDSFTLSEMDKELVCMVLIRALPEEYSSFASSLQLLDKFEKEKIQEAFVAEELLRNRPNNPDTLNNSNNTTGLAATALQAATPLWPATLAVSRVISRPTVFAIALLKRVT